MEICPFVSGRALKPAEFHDRQAEVQRVLDRLVTSQSTAIIGQPHSGKTSFLNYLLHPESRRQIVGHHLDRSVFAYLNSQNLGDRFDSTRFLETGFNAFNRPVFGRRNLRNLHHCGT
jgi:hypothetical protein